MNCLHFIKLEFETVAIRNFIPQGYTGNKLRGAIGSAMNKLFCDEEKVHCENCDNLCIYGKVFKPISYSEEFTTAPAPFVIEMSEFDKEGIKKGDILSFSISIFGDRVVYWQDLMEAVLYSFSQGDKIFNASFRIMKVISKLENKVIWENGNIVDYPDAVAWSDEELQSICGYDFDSLKIRIKFISPLLLKNEPTKDWGFSEFIEAVFYRTGSIIDLYEDDRFYVLYGLLYRKPYIKTEIISLKDNKLELTLEGDLRKYLVYIDIGSHLHIGKKATYGFGQYEFEIIE
jgi:hypothetical protein